MVQSSFLLLRLSAHSLFQKRYDRLIEAHALARRFFFDRFRYFIGDASDGYLLQDDRLLMTHNMNQCDSIIAALFIQVKVIICQNRRDHSYLVRDEAFRVIEFVVIVEFNSLTRHNIAIDIASSACGSAFEKTLLKPCDGYCDFRQDNAAAIHKVKFSAVAGGVYERFPCFYRVGRHLAVNAA